MITDKIKFKPGYAKADSKTFASAGVEVGGAGSPDNMAHLQKSKVPMPRTVTTATSSRVSL